MKNTILWVLFFSVCMAVGFLHGVLPQGLSKSYFAASDRLQVVTTDEIFFPEAIRAQLENELNVKFSVVVTRDWESILANVVASPSVDLIFLPSYWAQTLTHQNLLTDISGPGNHLRQKLSSDFAGQGSEGIYFLPFYWMKTQIVGRQGETFIDFLANKKESTLFLLADEDLLLRHFQLWKEQGLWDQVQQKKILTMQLDELDDEDTHLGAYEGAVSSDNENPAALDKLGALLIYGAAIPNNSADKNLTIEVLNALSDADLQKKGLLQTPFNTTFSAVTGDDIPLRRRADFIRNLQLKKTLILDRKDQEARRRLQNEFNFAL